MPNPEDTQPATTPYEDKNFYRTTADDESEMKAWDQNQFESFWKDVVNFLVAQQAQVLPYTSPTGDSAFADRVNQIMQDHLSDLEANPSLPESDVYRHRPDSPAANSSVSNVTQAADPVNLFDGNFTYSAMDFQINGAGIEFVFKRAYSQLSFYNGPLGFNWDYNYNLWLRISDDGTIIHRSTGSLKEEIYTRHEEHEYWTPPDGAMGVLLANNGSFIHRLPDGSQIFYQPHQTLPPSIHVVTRLENRFGNYLAFIYADGLLTRVEVNHADRLLHFGYDTENRITSITDFSGRSWRYGYDDFGDLVSLTLPATTQYKAGLTTRYEYSTPLISEEIPKHNLISIINADGNIYLENEYGIERNLLAHNRVLRQRQGGGDILFDYAEVIEDFDFPYEPEERPAHQTIVTERDGRQVRYLFNRFGGMIFKEEYARIDGIPKPVSTHYRYNADGNLIGTISSAGIINQYLYGRDFYERRFPPGNDYRREADSNLTPAVRQTFGNLLSVVKRGRYYDIASLERSQGLWSNSFFPDIFQTNDEDVVQKFTYEPEFAQLVTVSDPRFTDSSDPAATEGPEYERHLTKSSFSSGSGHQNFFIKSIEQPQPTFPDGTLSEPVVTQFTDFDKKGRLLRMIAANGLVTINSYFQASDGLLEGFLQTTTMDPEGFEVKVGTDRDNLGRIVKEYRSPHFNLQDGRFFSTLEYNELDQLVRSTGTAPFSITTQNAYTRTGNLAESTVELKDENNSPVGFFSVKSRYDSELNLISQKTGDLENELFKLSKILYDRSARPFLSIAASGRKTKTYFNERALASKTVNDYGGVHATTRRFYDADGRMIRIIDTRGAVTRFRYDSLGRVVESEDAKDNRFTRRYDKTGNLLVECRYQKKEGETFLLLSRQQASYDELGRKIVAGVNKFENVAPISLNQLASSFLDSGPGELLTVKYFYNTVGDLFRLVDQSGREFTSEFDLLGRVTKDTDPYGNESMPKYDKENNLIRIDRREMIKDPGTDEIVSSRCFAETLSYDELNRVIEDKTSTGRIRYVYDSRGNQVETINALDNSTRKSFDIFDRLIQSTQFLRHTSAEAPTEISVHFTYDLDDNRTSQIDALGRSTSFEYDTLGRLTRTVLPDASSDSREYDRAGNLVVHRDRNGLIKNMTWDELQRNILMQIDPAGVSGVHVETATQYQSDFDALDRITRAENDFVIVTFKYNSLGHILRETIAFKPATGLDPSVIHAIERVFSDNGAVIEIRYPSGREISYERDVLDRIVRLKQTQKGANYPGNLATPDNMMIAEIQYEGLQRKAILRAPGIATHYTYDFAGRVAEIKHSAGDSNILTLQFLHDALGEVQQSIEVSEDFQNIQSSKYDSLSRLFETNESQTVALIDPASISPPASLLPEDLPDHQSQIDQLVQAVVGPQPSNIYDYDLVGNRTSRINAGLAETYQVNELDQYTNVDAKTYVYDQNGNLMEDGSFRYQYDYRDQLSKVVRKSDNSETLFFFDYFGRRCAHKTGTETGFSLFEGQNLLEEHENNNLKSSVLSETDQDSFLLLSNSSDEFYLLSDLVRSIRYVFKQDTKHNFYRYDEFGNLRESLIPADENPFRFGSKRLLSDTLKYDFIFRAYDPLTGKFMQRDPKAFIDGTNLYSYVSNNPLSYIDPLGLEPKESTTGERITFKGDPRDWRPPGWGWFDESVNFMIEGGKSAKAAARYATLTPDQTWAKEILDRGWGCTACHVSVYVWNTLGPEAINPDNLMPYDWAIDRKGFSRWALLSAQSRFFVESMTMIGSTKVGINNSWARAAQFPPTTSTLTPSTTSLVESEVASLRAMANQPLTSVDLKLYRGQYPTVTLDYPAAMATNPGNANFLRFNAEWAQTAGPLRRGSRPSADSAMRRTARNYMDQTGFSRSGLNAMHPLDSVANPFVRQNTQIGSTYYFGNSSVNQSFGSQLGNRLNSLGLKVGDRFWLEFRNFPDYSVHPPTAPPASPSNL